jgi:hypothetical protein
MRSRLGRRLVAAALWTVVSACGGKAALEKASGEPQEEPEDTTPRIASGIDDNVRMSELIEREKLALCLAILEYSSAQVPSALYCRGDGYVAAMEASGGSGAAAEACQRAFSDCEFMLPDELATSCDTLPSYDACYAWAVDVELFQADSIDVARGGYERLPTCEQMEDYLADPWTIDGIERPASCRGMDESCFR